MILCLYACLYHLPLPLVGRRPLGPAIFPAFSTTTYREGYLPTILPYNMPPCHAALAWFLLPTIYYYHTPLLLLLPYHACLPDHWPTWQEQKKWWGEQTKNNLAFAWRTAHALPPHLPPRFTFPISPPHCARGTLLRARRTSRYRHYYYTVLFAYLPTFLTFYTALHEKQPTGSSSTIIVNT